MLDIFAFLLLGAAAFAAFNLISRTVEAQRRETGIGMALGVPPSALARRPFLLSAQIAVAGVALGIPVGLAADAWLAGVMDQFFPLPVVRASFQTDIYVRGAALGLALPLLAAAVPVWRALRVTRSRRSESARAPRAAAASRGLCGACACPGRAGQPPTAQRPAHAAPHADDAPWDRGGRDDRDRARRGHGLLRRDACREPPGSARRLTAAPDRRARVPAVAAQHERSGHRGRVERREEPDVAAAGFYARVRPAAHRSVARGARRPTPDLASDAPRRHAAEPCNPGWSSRGARRSTCTYRSATASAWCIRSRLDRRPSGSPRRRCP